MQISEIHISQLANWFCAVLTMCLLTNHVWGQSEPIDLRGVKIWPQARKIEVKGVVNMNTGLVELLATTPGGKEHESVFLVNANPTLLQTALLIIGLTPLRDKRVARKPEQGDKIIIEVRWKINDQKYSKRAENVIWNRKYNRPMGKNPWVFTGSRFGKNSYNGREVFRANTSGSVIATYYDPDAIINNILPDCHDDTVYYANDKVLPPRGTLVTLVLTPAQ